MKTKSLLCAVALMTGVSVHAQTAKDSVKVQNTDEVVVTGHNHRRIANGIASIPSPQVRRQSMNMYDLLARMMVPGLVVKPIDKAVETAWGEAVKVFIDGQAATDADIRALRPRDVLRVEYLQHPTDPQYQNASSAVNVVLRKYEYGGYALLSTNQGFVNNYGDYGTTLKVDRKKMTYRGYVGAYYGNMNGQVNEQHSQYRLNNRLTDRYVSGKTDTDNQMYTAAFSARYFSGNVLWMMQAGMKYARKPKDITWSNLRYQVDGVDGEQTHSVTDASSKSLSPYASATFQLTGLPHKAWLYAEASFSYNQNKALSEYQVEPQTSISNSYNEKAYFPNLYLSYTVPVKQKGVFSLRTTSYGEIYRTNYMGTENSLQKLVNVYVQPLALYQHTFSQSWNATVYASAPVQIYKVNNSKRRSKAYINGGFSVNGWIGRKHALMSSFDIWQSQISPSNYNTVVRQDNELEGSKGNLRLKTVQHTSFKVAYTWMPSNQFSLNASVYWEAILKDIVPYWHEENGLMVNEKINSGNYHPLYFNLIPSANLFNGKLLLSAKISYCREWHSGLHHLKLGYWGIYPSATYNITNNFSVFAGYAQSFGDRGYMRGTSYLSRFSSNLRAGAQYSWKDLYVSLQMNSILRKNGWVKTWMDIPNYRDYRYVSRPSDGRYVMLSVSYNLNFGKKINRGDDIRYSGKNQTSVL